MELGAIFLLLLVLGVMFLLISQPFSKHRRVKKYSSDERSSLLVESGQALTALQELNFDDELAKIPHSELSTRRGGSVRRGLDGLQGLDEIQRVDLSQAKEPDKKPATDRQAGLLSDEDLEDLIAKRRSERRQKTAGFCPKCGRPILESDKFCPTCGQMVSLK